MQLPGGFAKVLHGLGRGWPMTDEEKLFKLGGAWLDFASEFEPTRQRRELSRRTRLVGAER